MPAVSLKVFLVVIAVQHGHFPQVGRYEQADMKSCWGAAIELMERMAGQIKSANTQYGVGCMVGTGEIPSGLGTQLPER